MVYYVILIILSLTQLILYIVENRNGNKIIYKPSMSIYFLFVGSLIFIAGFRKGIGYDFRTYEKLYHFIHNTNLSMSMIGDRLKFEYGYILLNKIIPSFPLLVLLVAIFSVGIKSYCIYKYSNVPILVLLLYFCSVFLTFDMGIIRQGISIALYWIILDLISRHKTKMAILFTVIGCLFHLSSLIFLLVILWGKKIFSKKIIYLSIIFSLMFYFVDFGNVLVSIFSRLGLDIITTKIVFYYTSGVEKVSFISLLKRIIILILFTETYEKFIETNRERVFFNSYYFSVVLMSLFSSIDILGGRGVHAFYSAQFFLLGIMYEKEKNILLKFLVFAICIALSLDSMMGTISFGNITNQLYTPYRSIWQ